MPNYSIDLPTNRTEDESNSNGGTLNVCSLFYSVQGEGQTMGIPSYFIRLAKCTLACGWKREKGKWVKDKEAGWHCDSLPEWIQGEETPFGVIIKKLDGKDQGSFIRRIRNRSAHLIFTGGEPIIHQKKIMDFLTFLETTYGVSPIVEIETSATLNINADLLHRVDYWNVSPKLENSGMEYKRRIKPFVLMELDTTKGSIFKFVVSQKSDIDEILTLSNYEYISRNKIYLMPAGETQEELSKVRPWVLELCKQYGLKYSDRLQVVAWNETLGV